MEQDAIKQEDMNEEMSHQSAAGDGSAGDTEGTALDQSTAQQEHADPAPADEPDNRVPDGDTAQRIEEPNAAEDAQAQAHSDGTDGMGQGMEGKDADKGTGTQSASKAKPSNAQKEHDASEDSDRHLGDASQSFMRRLEQIADPSDPVDRENGLPEAEMTEVPPDAEVEHVRDNNDNTGLQAMGPAAREADSKIDTEKADPDIVDDFESLGLDPLEAPVAETHQHFIPESSDQTSLDYSNSTSLSDAKAAVEQYEEADAHNKVKELSIDEEDVPAHADTVLQHWLASGRESLPAEEVWRLYSNLTRDISFSLTESLRLVLEPTLATRLKGDYRTGKRLNMRKIIPYIASDYTKDKIWLRRTRPSQREYQVLLALDDSRSMSDSKAVHLAYQTLALVCQSLTKLEVGEVSLCKFGEYTDFIHNFEDGPVTDSVGAKIVDSFSFAQRSTDVRRLLESSLQRFQSARERRGGTAADLWQLEIIVSDGMCQDLEDIRSLLRKAREQKVMVMFVVLDSLHHNGPAANGNGPSENSILSMKSVSYQRGKSGALELKMERYMDTFPFEYYVILREVESLPEILGETLRQFFDKVN